MAKNNKSYRIRTTVGKESDSFLSVHLDQDYDSLEVLSLKIKDKDTYKLHNSDYGVIVGRVLANGNFGVPNAKISVFIPSNEQNSSLDMWTLYPYTSTSTKNEDNIRYNLLPDESVKDCHKAVGTFPNKTFLLENDAILEVFDKYYVYTTRTNAAGDYLICGVPTGNQTLHMDLDLSDCGILSQRPRDFVYKGYTIEQFENPNQFKKDENIDGLSQIFSQNQPVYVQPFWGNEDNGETIGITRADINVAFKFEPTCVFMGSAVSDSASHGVGKKCVPSNQMGLMEELTAGEGTIEMIRKTPGGNVEEFSVKGNQVIDGNGVWCYQIPMNLDYMMTDEYGNMVPTDDPEKGIPTRARVRFRVSLTDMDGSSQSYYRAKYLVPNNPGVDDDTVDYNFGTYTDENSYRDLFWNGVYTVKSYIPRFQKSKRWRNERFSGIKACNYYAGNNPMPYNNLRIKLPFMFIVLCIFVKLFIKIVTIINRFQGAWLHLSFISKKQMRKKMIHCTYIGDGLCPDMEGWYFAPACGNGLNDTKEFKDILIEQTLKAAQGGGETPDSDEGDSISSSEYIDETSIDNQNTTTKEEETVCLTKNVDFLLNCFEMNLANEYRVIKFDFYNDWVNGVLYFPRWMRKVKRKKKYKITLNKGLDNLVTTYYKDKVQGCMNSENSTVKKSRYYTQQCSLMYTGKPNRPWTTVKTEIACNGEKKRDSDVKPARCHKKNGMDQSSIFGKKSGLVTEETTMLNQNVYYLKPCEWKDTENGRKRTLLFATDIVLLGTLNDCDENGIPQAFKYLNNTSYIMPTNLALTTMDNDPYIYSDDGGSVCISSTEKKMDPEGLGEKVLKDSVRRITPSYETTSEAYKKTEFDKLEYAENDDPVPITEAAGITWNYSGPGQDDVLAGEKEKPKDLVKRLFGGGNKRYNYVYYPGGHFLGLSCVNSETNIKSCVNLKRICEVGATMSQRREELRGYTVSGNPMYRYYVPTGLISNVDIEGASFRSMFSTLNHNKLIATKTDPKTYYKKYDFRFLRPDGFDGALSEYIHKSGSPYNRKVNHDDIVSAPDESSIFARLFPNWFQTDDYDKEESGFTETRTIEDTVNDYYMFRFGLNDFSDKEQRKRYLLKKGSGYSMPQYENSFYFYFGLKDGATALDEFKKQFFSECEANNVMKNPNLSIIEKFDDKLQGTATLVIDNMVGPYTIIIRDNTMPQEEGVNPVTITVNDDTIELGEYIDLKIGHEYTVTVTDSIDRTMTKMFTFGESSVAMDVEVVHFRYDRETAGTTKIDAKSGGYFKIGDSYSILGKQYSLSDTASTIELKCKNISNDSTFVLQEEFNYVDSAGEIQHVFFIPGSIGIYEILLKLEGAEEDVSVNTVTVEDNTDVELYVSCDYFGYKSGYGLSGVTDEDWLNGDVFTGASSDSWLFRHTFYRQTENDYGGYDCNLYTYKSKTEIAVFGWPEAGGLTNEGKVSASTFYKNDYESYEGYTIDESWSFIPTMYWNPETHEMEEVIGRNPFDVMVYTEDGRSAADASDIVLTSISQTGDNVSLVCTGSGLNNIPGIKDGHGCIVILENGKVLFPVITSLTDSQMALICYNETNPYSEVTDADRLDVLLSMSVVYPTLRVPVIYKPFFGEISAMTWNLTGATVNVDENGTVPVLVELPTSYKIEGVIHNGLSFNNKFCSGRTDTSTATPVYETYLIDEDNPAFFMALSALTEDDYKYDKTFRFGENNMSAAYAREISNSDVDTREVNTIEYAVLENYPVFQSGTTKYNEVYSGRYAGEFDLYKLEDSTSLASIFHKNLRIFAYTDDGRTGRSCLCADSVPNSSTTVLYGIKTPTTVFKDDGPLKTDGEMLVCCGIYNKNAEYDKKGATTIVLNTSGNFAFRKTQENGMSILKSVNSETALNDEGITLQHKFTMLPEFIRNISGITENILGSSAAVQITATTLYNGAPKGSPTIFDNIERDYSTIIAKYTRPDSGSKNKMVIYRAYPVKALEVIYPSMPTGLNPFISPQERAVCDYRPQTISITVSTNVHFKVSSDSSWATVNSTTTFGPETTSIQVTVASNEGSSTSNRTATITFTSNETGVSPVITARCLVTQLKDDITPVENKAERAQNTASAAAADAARANRRIDNLPQN